MHRHSSPPTPILSSLRLAALAALVTLAHAAPAAAQCECPVRDLTIIGHRGAGSSGADDALVENTIASAQQAFTEGAHMVEIDVQRSADGAVVLMHDDTVDRTTGGTGCVSALTLAELEALEVPTLADFLSAVDGRVNIEIKLHEDDACPAQDLDGLVDAVLADVGAAAAQDRVLVSSFSLEVLRRVRAGEPSIPIGYLTLDVNDIDVAAAEGFEAIHLLSIAADARAVRRAHDAGLAVNVWTVNGPVAIENALRASPDGVITDTAAEAVTARDTFCAELVCPGADAGVGPADGGVEPSSGGCSAGGGGRAPLGLLLVVAASLFVRRTSR